MSNKRFRLLTEQVRDGKYSRHISSVILSEKEAHENLRVESDLHRATGWSVGVTPDGAIICEREGVKRTISIRVFEAMEDHLSDDT